MLIRIRPFVKEIERPVCTREFSHYHCEVSFYPKKVNERLQSHRNASAVTGENASGKDASFVCGSYVRFSLRIDPDSKSVLDIRFQTNGCGFMFASADCLAETVKGKQLSDLHGSDDNELRNFVFETLGDFDENRLQCLDSCVRALHYAFADYRARQIEEFQGEKALICSCFGVTEETIESCIYAGSIKTVGEVTMLCNAGGGCGSCRMLIQEMLDSVAAR